jgi:multiple sugar transport system substrate-binding protein
VNIKLADEKRLAPRAFPASIDPQGFLMIQCQVKRTRKMRPSRQHNLGGIDMIRKVLCAALASTALMVGVAQATETIVWWDFLSGGDGIRMKTMLDEFNKEHDGKVKIDATTSEWGTPFYTKVQTAAATGQGPDVMTYHESRMPLGVSEGVLSELKPEELAAAGIKASDFSPANWKAAQGPDGKQYAVPLDIHSIILYYNKDMLKKAGLLGDDGKPKGLDGVDNFNAALAKLTGNGVTGLSVPNDGGSGWRIFYTLLNQQGGQFLKDGKFLDGDNLAKAETALAEMQSWTKNKWAPTNTEYPASIALFTSGKAAMHINGVWEVPTMVDLAKKRQLFDWGAIQIPVLYSQPATWADSHSFAIPDRKGNPLTPEKRKLVLDTIHWFNQHSLEWAGGGHVPSYLPVQDSAEFKALKPNSDYVSLAKTAVFDPVSIYAGVASPVYDAAGNYMIPALNGDVTPAAAAKGIRDDLQALAK